MAAYFHQDWWEEYDGSWKAAAEDFARRLDAMGNYRSPGDSPTAHVDWLNDILLLLASGRQNAQRLG